MPQEIFRKASLDRLSSPDQLDQLRTVTSPRAWLALLALIAVLGMSVVWAFTGSVSTKVMAQGLLVHSQGVFNVPSTGAGRLVELRVKPNDYVRVNQVIAVVAQPELTQRIRHARESESSAKRQRDEVIAARSEGLQMRLGILKRQRENLAHDIANADLQVKLAAEQIPVNERLEQRGVISRQTVIADRQKLAALESQTAQLRTQVTALAAEEQTLVTQLIDAKRELTYQVTNLEQSTRLLELDLSQTSQVISPYAGKVLELKVSPGGLVGIGSPIISVEPGDKTLEVLAYVPSAQAKSVRRAMRAEVSPSTVKREEYGFIRGDVTYVAEFPATPASIMKELENEALARSLSGAPVTEVRAKLQEDSTTVSGFRWSSSRGPTIALSSGTLVTLHIVTRERRPATLILPFLKEKLGGN